MSDYLNISCFTVTPFAGRPAVPPPCNGLARGVGPVDALLRRDRGGAVTATDSSSHSRSSSASSDVVDHVTTRSQRALRQAHPH